MKGNELWKQALGRPRKIKDPNHLWEVACEYFQWCDDNPLLVKDWVGKDAIEVEKEHLRAYTIHGLCIFMGVNTKYLNDLMDDKPEIYSEVVTRIREVIYTQKFEGAAAGLLNQNIIARDLGLIERKQQDVNLIQTVTETTQFKIERKSKK